MKEYTNDYDINVYSRAVYGDEFNWYKAVEQGLSDIHISLYHLIRDSAGHLVADVSYEYAGLHLPLDEVSCASEWFKDQLAIDINDDDSWGSVSGIVELPDPARAPYLHDFFKTLAGYEVEKVSE